MTSLTPHFSFEELTATSVHTASNAPSPEVLSVLSATAVQMEIVRCLLANLPIHINSAYRSAAVNTAVGGVSNSAHMTGHAVDFICPQAGAPLAICRTLFQSHLLFDQLIEEGTWVHISFAPTLRRELLTKQGDGYKRGLQ